MSITTLTPLTAKGAARRTAILQGLANLSAFIETHPQLPLGGPYSETPFTALVFGGTNAENRAEVERIADILGVTATESHPGCRQYTASRDFGGGVEYRALAIAPRPIGAAA